MSRATRALMAALLTLAATSFAFGQEAPASIFCREATVGTDIGAEVLILPPHAPCDAAPAPGFGTKEWTQKGDVWAPGFWFARDDLIFIRNWGISSRQTPFAIYRYGEPAPVFTGSIRVERGSDIRLQPQPSGTMRLHFTTTHFAECSVPALGQDCIRTIATATGAPPVDPALCRADYDRAAKFYRQNMDDAPTVVAYPVVLALGQSAASFRPDGAVTECYLAD